MKFKLDSSQIFVPDGTPEAAALRRTTHLAIGAHQDDLEIFAIDGILTCYQDAQKRFTGVVVTDGSGSPRSGAYKDCTDRDLREIRINEQKKAAMLGGYAAQVFLDYPSAVVKDPADDRPVQDILQILQAASAQVVYTHNLADKHDTHVAVALRVIQAARMLEAGSRPLKLYGCEVWRDLDWMLDEDKVVFDVSEHEGLQAALLGVFDSQTAGGKRYDRAALGRRHANATLFNSHAVDRATGMAFAMDLTPLIENPGLNSAGYVQDHIQRFAQDVNEKIHKFLASE